MKKISSFISLVTKDYYYTIVALASNDGIEVAGSTVYLGDTAGSWFQYRRFR